MSRSVNYPMGLAQGVTAGIVNGEVVFTLPPMANAVDWEYRFDTSKDPSNADWLSATLLTGDPDDATCNLPDDTTIYLQLRPVNAAGGRGAPSNVASLTTPRVVGLAYKDHKMIMPSATAGATQPNPISLVGLGLNFAAGDGLAIFAQGLIYASGLGGTQTVGRGTVTGWTEVGFKNVGGSGSYRAGARVLTKTATGTEDVVTPLVWSGGAGTIENRVAYFVVSFTKDGEPEGYGSVGAEITTDDPLVQQVVPATSAINPLLAFSLAGAVSNSTSMTMTGDTLNIAEQLVSGFNFAAALRLKFYDIDATVHDLAADMPDLGFSNSLMSGAITMMETV